MANRKNDLVNLIGDFIGENPNEDARTKRRTKGLPQDDAPIELARTYLKGQHRLWPDLAKAGLLPKRRVPTRGHSTSHT